MIFFRQQHPKKDNTFTLKTGDGQSLTLSEEAILDTINTQIPPHENGKKRTLTASEDYWHPGQ